MDENLVPSTQNLLEATQQRIPPDAVGLKKQHSDLQKELASFNDYNRNWFKRIFGRSNEVRLRKKRDSLQDNFERALNQFQQLSAIHRQFSDYKAELENLGGHDQLVSNLKNQLRAIPEPIKVTAETKSLARFEQTLKRTENEIQRLDEHIALIRMVRSVRVESLAENEKASMNNTREFLKGVVSIDILRDTKAQVMSATGGETSDLEIRTMTGLLTTIDEHFTQIGEVNINLREQINSLNAVSVVVTQNRATSGRLARKIIDDANLILQKLTGSLTAAKALKKKQLVEQLKALEQFGYFVSQETNELMNDLNETAEAIDWDAQWTKVQASLDLSDIGEQIESAAETIARDVKELQINEILSQSLSDRLGNLEDQINNLGSKDRIAVLDSAAMVVSLRKDFSDISQEVSELNRRSRADLKDLNDRRNQVKNIARDLGIDIPNLPVIEYPIDTRLTENIQRFFNQERDSTASVFSKILEHAEEKFRKYEDFCERASKVTQLFPDINRQFISEKPSLSPENIVAEVHKLQSLQASRDSILQTIIELMKTQRENLLANWSLYRWSEHPDVENKATALRQASLPSASLIEQAEFLDEWLSRYYQCVDLVFPGCCDVRERHRDLLARLQRLKKFSGSQLSVTIDQLIEKAGGLPEQTARWLDLLPQIDTLNEQVVTLERNCAFTGSIG